LRRPAFGWSSIRTGRQRVSYGRMRTPTCPPMLSTNAASRPSLGSASSLRRRNRLHLWLQIELRQDRPERRERGLATCLDRGPKKSGERLALGIRKFKLHTSIFGRWRGRTGSGDELAQRGMSSSTIKDGAPPAAPHLQCPSPSCGLRCRVTKDRHRSSPHARPG
jgi:hypothetical protein